MKRQTRLLILTFSAILLATILLIYLPHTSVWHWAVSLWDGLPTWVQVCLGLGGYILLAVVVVVVCVYEAVEMEDPEDAERFRRMIQRDRIKKFKAMVDKGK
jgi:hypothetical protein